MNLSICPIASSSKGNSYIIKSDETLLMLDMGISGLKMQKAFKYLNLKIKDIDGIMVTHEHVDHVRGCDKIFWVAEKSKLYCSKGTFEGMLPKVKPIPEERIQLVENNQSFMVGDI